MANEKNEDVREAKKFEEIECLGQKNGTFERFRRYIVEKAKWEGTDEAWEGIVVTNKDQRITVYNKRNEPFHVDFVACRPQKAGRIVLQELMRKAMEDGPRDMVRSWYATGTPQIEMRRDELKKLGLHDEAKKLGKQLEIKITLESVNVNDPAGFAASEQIAPRP